MRLRSNRDAALVIDQVLATIARKIVVPAYARRFRRFEQRVRNARALQRKLLLDWVARCRATRFGKEHGFARIRTIEDYRRQVPVAGYDRFAPYIDAIGRCEQNVLFPPDEVVRRFTITTGTTGTPKLNPVTPTWLKHYRRAWDLWGAKMLSDHPDKVGGGIMQIIGTWDMGQTPGGIPISMVSALLSRNQHPLVRRFYSVPTEVIDIREAAARHYATMRLSVARQVSLIVLMSPGSLIRLVKLADENRESLIRDIHDGTLSSAFDIPAETRQKLQSRISTPNPARARELEQIVDQTGRLYPRDYWRQPIIACWVGGTAGHQSRYLSDYFGPAPLRDQGLVSSEGRHTIPIEDDKPEGVLSVDSGYYEFVPADEADSDAPTVLEGHELELDRDYSLVMTTYSGYFRFQIGDIVRCRGFLGEAPILEFLQKAGRCGDLEGEKLTERQFLDAADVAAEELGIQLGWVTAVASREPGGRPRYEFLIEHGDVPDQELALRFLNRVDELLAKSNFLYSARRRERVLDSPRLVRLRTGEWGAYVQAEIARRGTGEAQYKHPGMITDPSWLTQFNSVDRITLSEETPV